MQLIYYRWSLLRRALPISRSWGEVILMFSSLPSTSTICSPIASSTVASSVKSPPWACENACLILLARKHWGVCITLYSFLFTELLTLLLILRILSFTGTQGTALPFAAAVSKQ